MDLPDMGPEPFMSTPDAAQPENEQAGGPGPDMEEAPQQQDDMKVLPADITMDAHMDPLNAPPSPPPEIGGAFKQAGSAQDDGGMQLDGMPLTPALAEEEHPPAAAQVCAGHSAQCSRPLHASPQHGCARQCYHCCFYLPVSTVVASLSACTSAINTPRADAANCPRHTLPVHRREHMPALWPGRWHRKAACVYVTSPASAGPQARQAQGRRRPHSRRH